MPAYGCARTRVQVSFLSMCAAHEHSDQIGRTCFERKSPEVQARGLQRRCAAATVRCFPAIRRHPWATAARQAPGVPAGAGGPGKLRRARFARCRLRPARQAPRVFAGPCVFAGAGWPASGGRRHLLPATPAQTAANPRPLEETRDRNSCLEAEARRHSRPCRSPPRAAAGTWTRLSRLLCLSLVGLGAGMCALCRRRRWSRVVASACASPPRKPTRAPPRHGHLALRHGCAPGRACRGTERHACSGLRKSQQRALRSEATGSSRRSCVSTKSFGPLSGRDGERFGLHRLPWWNG